MRETFTFNVESFQILNVLSIKKRDIFTTDIFFGGGGGLGIQPTTAFIKASPDNILELTCYQNERPEEEQLTLIFKT